MFGYKEWNYVVTVYSVDGGPSVRCMTSKYVLVWGASLEIAVGLLMSHDPSQEIKIEGTCVFR